MKRVFFLFLVIYVASCTERIDIKTNDTPSRIAIYGHISSDPMPHSIRITHSAGYFSDDSPEGVSNAIVTISDDDGNVIPLAENADTQGLYETSPDVYGEEGKTYTLDVLLETGEHYRASAHLQTINIDIDSIGLQVSRISNTFVETLLYAHDTERKNYYSFFVAINDSVVNPTIDDFLVRNDVLLDGRGVACYFLNQEPDHEYRNEKLNIGDKVTLNINAIPKEYATFISNVQSELRGSMPIFGGPPANVPTNIVSLNDATPALGFFSAFPSRYAHTIVKEDFSIKNK